LTFGIFIGVVFGKYIPQSLNTINHSLYSRASLDNIMRKLLGNFTVSQVLTDELLVVAYDYNSNEPRLYSKYFAMREPLIYDLKVGNATGASSAAPTYFDPKVNENAFGIKELVIDGGIIANNPALYAYELARSLKGHEKIRVLSIGTGEKSFNGISSKASLIDYMMNSGEFMF
jgi:patatin-like phospholipase/acyl hydrolase